VFLARTVTGLLRAVKVVRRRDFEMEKTFEREFEGIQHYEKVSQDHPGLVDVLHVGRDAEAGFYYYVMDLADDENDGHEDIDVETYRPRTLSSDLKQNPARGIDECIRLGIAMAGALGHLHRAGLTHRDVKPSNIIFVKGRPQLADIGLVARDGQRTYVGTEGYVPPEGPGTTSADLYSLAMVLYEMHTGKDRLDFPELPTNMELPPTVNRDEWRAMNSVICRAGSPDSRKRFETAHAFAAALHKILKDREPQSPGTGNQMTLRKLILTTLALLFLGMMGAGYWLWKDRERFWGKNPTPPTQHDGNDASKTGSRTDAPPPLASSPDNSPDKTISDPGISIFNRDPFSHMNSDADVVISDSSTAVPPRAKKPRKKIVAQPVPRAFLKIFSYPSGATVWKGDEEIGRTPTGFIEFEPGPVELELKRSGYHDYHLAKALNEGRQSEQIELIEDLRPGPGQQHWVNSVGVAFSVDAQGVFVSDRPVMADIFEQYLRETKRNVPAVVVGDAVQLKEERAVWDFCDWMTDKDRTSGYLDEKTYHAPLRIQAGGKDDSFFCSLEHRFGTLILNSEPTGADLYRGKTFIGKTPIVLNPIRYGPFRFEVNLPGHQSEFAEGFITNAEAVPMTIPLKRDSSLLFGQKWQNSQGMPLVPVGDFMAAIYETRVQDYAHFLAENSDAIAPPQLGDEQKSSYPVAGVSASDADIFCRWLTDRERAMRLIQPEYEYRLPTDLEWSEMAGLKNEKGKTPEERDSQIVDQFPWGSIWPPAPGSGNFADLSASRELGKYVISGYQDGYPKTAPVGAFGENQEGLFDLSGNVWEWVQDRYSGPGSTLGVVRGGAWNSYEREVLLSSYRNAVPPDLREELYGFRYVLAKVERKKINN